MFRNTNAYRKISRGYSKNLPEYLAFRYKRYPEFVYDQNPKPLKNEIPVFTLHSVEPTRFEEQLEYLSRNGYQTAGCRSSLRIYRRNYTITGKDNCSNIR